MSTSESKKKSSSSKRSSKEDDVPIEQVHTANNWEKADLGDNERKQKFLRLMGAKKRKDDSEADEKVAPADAEVTVPEKKHCRSKTETEEINRDLEKQFNESLQSKLMHTHHGGLGFSEGSSSHDWHQPSKKLAFVPAAAEVTTEKEKPEKKKKS